MNKWSQDIAEMHEKFGVNLTVRDMSKDKLEKFLDFRIKFLQEELDEMKLAAEKLEKDIGDVDEIVDALIDLCVVAIGTLDAYEVDADLAWDRVHEKNMEKIPGVKAERPNPLGLPDLIKPEGWEPPTHCDNIGLLYKLL